jgi:hypothetical protein
MQVVADYFLAKVSDQNMFRRLKRSFSEEPEVWGEIVHSKSVCQLTLV